MVSVVYARSSGPLSIVFRVPVNQLLNKNCFSQMKLFRPFDDWLKSEANVGIKRIQCDFPSALSSQEIVVHPCYFHFANDQITEVIVGRDRGKHQKPIRLMEKGRR